MGSLTNKGGALLSTQSEQ